jgi:hypothetical protein
LKGSPLKKDDIMINEAALRDALIAIAIGQKASAEQFFSLAVEVAALRDTVRSLDPTFSETFEFRKQEKRNLASPDFLAVTGLCDEIIRQLKAGEVC